MHTFKTIIFYTLVFKTHRVFAVVFMTDQISSLYLF